MGRAEVGDVARGWSCKAVKREISGTGGEALATFQPADRLGG